MVYLLQITYIYCNIANISWLKGFFIIYIYDAWYQYEYAIFEIKNNIYGAVVKVRLFSYLYKKKQNYEILLNLYCHK